MNRAAFAVVYLGLAAADLFLTLHGLQNGAVELNPLAYWFLLTGGFVGLTLYKVFLTGVLVTLVYRYYHGRFARYFGYTALALLAATVLNNVLVVS